MSNIRLDKMLVSQNIGSRREVAKLISRGEVRVNGKTERLKDKKIDPQNAIVEVSGQKVEYKEYLYIMMNKPKGVVSASRDPKKKTIVDLVEKELYRKDLFPAGRLDIDTEGLIIITNDGDFAHRMLSPKKKVYKIYEAIVDKEIGPREIEAFKAGIVFKDGTECLPAELKILEGGENYTKTEVSICEGKFHQVKKMFLAVGARVLNLKRKQIGLLKLDEKLAQGKSRELTDDEKNDIFIG